jgi:hypothetical protein
MIWLAYVLKYIIFAGTYITLSVMGRYKRMTTQLLSRVS